MNLVFLDGEEEEEVLDEDLRSRGVDVPPESVQDVHFHLLHLFQREESTAELEDGVHGRLGAWDEQVLVLVELDRHVQARHCQKLEEVLVDGALVRSKVPVEMVHGNADHLAVKVEVIDDCGNCLIGNVAEERKWIS